MQSRVKNYGKNNFQSINFEYFLHNNTEQKFLSLNQVTKRKLYANIMTPKLLAY